MLDLVRGVGRGGEAAAQLDVLGGHFKLAIVDGGTLGCPAGEVVAGGGSRFSDRYLSAELVLRFRGKFRSILGSRAVILIGDLVLDAVIVDLDDGGAVGCDGLLREVLSGEAGVRLCRSIGIFAGRAVQVIRILERVLVVRKVLLIVLDLVRGVGRGRPLCVQVILAVIVDAGRLACLKRSTVAVSPANERVALASGKTGHFVGHDRDQTVVRDVVDCNGRAGSAGSTKVAVVGDGDRLRCLAVNGGQGDITVDRDLVVRVIPVACVVLPIEEDHVRGGSVHIVEDGGGCALAVALVVDHLIGSAVGAVGHAIADLADELGVQREVVGDLGFRVEGLAVLIDPAEEVLARGGLGVFGKGDGALVRNFACLIVLTINLEGDRMHRRNPLGVNDDVLRGHGLAVEVIGLRACGVSVPAREDVAFLARGRGGQLIVPSIGDGGLELVRLRLLRIAVVHIDHVVAIAVVVEFGVVVSIAIFSAIFQITGKTGNIVAVFIRYPAATGSSICMVQLIFAVKSFRVIIGFAISVSGLVEFFAVQRHGLKVELIGSSARRDCPHTARPLIADESAVLGGDGFKQLVGFIMAQKGNADPLDRVEPHLILVALVFHVDDGGAVACDDLLLDRLRGEAVIRLDRGCGLRTGSAGLRLGFHVGIVVIVGVFLPVDHGVADTLHGRPLGGQLDVRSKLAAEGELGIAIVPTSKVIARLSRGGGCLSGVSYELRFNIAAALGIKGNPVAICYDGVKIDRAARNVGNFFDLLGIFCPADN